ncbi:uncharacterized protein Z519_02115 [Cladophialophora bantiana CBS 173.52]|uniref:DNA mismatch repair protein HSM3 N-terminal domain-containing protein n=1 Tax=Cladophialophora bantiana (strain ATCC 10958 / CBS 173.52 / CDC B-1940 / NIH 8579) TaxID=1442370 RepID=A0A0D2IIW8_CLAB1|nr:uncharacterized protein Z519_02115 [Cladophialophora bantiana CBS 173.52]KIW96724.1 hypothetical protein Z519_02115 [Cladophialophora bantiana CBS 173.52]
MDALVEDTDKLFPEVFAHLAAVEAQPELPLDEELLKRAERNLTSTSPKDLLWRVLGTGEELLQTLQQDPRPLTRLLEQVISLLPFDELRSVISAEKLQEGLTSPVVSIQLLCLAYLRKAADSPSGASFVATSSSLVQCQFTIWLSSESTEVAERSLEVIEALLAVDSQNSTTVLSAGRSFAEAQGQGLLWRRVFHDPDVYTILFEWTSMSKSKRDVKTKKGMQLVTISQARLFDFIVRVAPYDWNAVTTSSLLHIETQFLQENGGSEPYGGILRYAASHMIDNKDILMEVLRQDFFVKLLGVVEESNRQNVSPQLLEAIQQGAGGLHL